MKAFLLLILNNMDVLSYNDNNDTNDNLHFISNVTFPGYTLLFTYIFMIFILFMIFFFKKHANLLVFLIYIELCLVVLGFVFSTLFLFSFVYFSGIVYALTILALSAAEAVVGLSLILMYFKASKGSISTTGFDLWPAFLSVHNKNVRRLKKISELKNKKC